MRGPSSVGMSWGDPWGNLKDLEKKRVLPYPNWGEDRGLTRGGTELDRGKWAVCDQETGGRNIHFFLL